MDIKYFLKKVYNQLKRKIHDDSIIMTEYSIYSVKYNFDIVFVVCTHESTLDISIDMPAVADDDDCYSLL